MTFGQGGDGRKLTERHPREREAQEYAKQIKQIHRFIEGPLHESSLGGPARWSVGQPRACPRSPYAQAETSQVSWCPELIG